MSLSVIMNSRLLYILVAGGLGLIFLLCAVMLKMAWGRCLELGISKQKIKDVIKSSVLFSIVPSISIVIGLFSLAAVDNGSIAGAIMFVMSIGIMFGIVTCTIFGKKIQTSMASFREKNGAWGALATGCFTLAMLVVFLPVQVFKGPVFTLTLITSALITLAHNIIIKKTGWTWLSNFVLADSLVLAMVASVFFDSLLA